MSKTLELLTIVGPTACGKTRLACNMAYQLGGEIISGDSRQVYRGMDIGTGKDLDDYFIERKPVPYHLIDIKPAGYHYNIFEFQNDFFKVFRTITDRGALPILCGGSGLYIEAAIRGYQLLDVPANPQLRTQLEEKSLEELALLLASYRTLHNSTDTCNKKRVIRAIEIAEYEKQHKTPCNSFSPPQGLVVGMDIDRQVRRDNITKRLKARLEAGMLEEVKTLLQTGLTPESLIYYGLEYKYLTEYITGKTTYEQMFSLLETAIHRFAKRQMTWFRGMQRRGVPIYWIDAALSLEKQMEQTNELITKYKNNDLLPKC
jgi:tRNA dimethylallyltransferase